MTAESVAERHGALVAQLARACHPEPTAAVTAMSTVLAVAVGLGPGRVLLVAAAVLTGQLTIGWSNDLLDARRDRASGRVDKPVATGRLPVGVVLAATGIALGACVPLSLSTGLRPGGMHLGVVASGWAYNLGLKRTGASWVPYATAFGLLPAFVVVAAGGSPALWLIAAGSLLGMGAHMFNVLPDLDDDAATGVRGAPVLLGRTATRWTGALLLLAAAGALVLGPAGAPTATGVVGLAVSAVLAVAAAVAGRNPRSRAPFLLALAVAALDVALLASRSAALV